MTKYKLTLQDLENQIASVDFQRFGDTGTLCVITLVNGYTVTGESGCIGPIIFNSVVGEDIAYKNAFDKLWSILGYGVKEKWYRETQSTWMQRVAEELADLDEKRALLIAFLEAPKSPTISDKQYDLMRKQLEAMTAYADILQERLTANEVCTPHEKVGMEKVCSLE